MHLMPPGCYSQPQTNILQALGGSAAAVAPDAPGTLFALANAQNFNMLRGSGAELHPPPASTPMKELVAPTSDSRTSEKLVTKRRR